MTIYTVFTTPGELDMQAVTIHGLNVKPNSTNPIGYFGTGLKYAIAVLLRHGIPITIYTGGQEYHFYTKETDFRGKTFKTCRYKAKGLFKGWKYVELPFTTELGKHWELWMAFRELMSNTLDEGGELISSEHFLEDLGVTDQIPKYTDPKQTWIVVEGQAFADVVAEKDQIFLPKDKLKLVASNSEVEIYEGSSRYIYYRGLRAYDLKTWQKESMYTYNYIGSGTTLTEDRTIKYIWYVTEAIAELIARSDDRKLIGSILKPGDRYYEKALDFSSVYSKSDTFNSVVYRLGSSPIANQMPSSARTYFSDVIQPMRHPVFKAPEVFNEAWDLITSIIQELVNKSKSVDNENAYQEVYKALQDAFDRKPPAIEVVMVPRDSVPEDDDIPF